MPGWLKQSTAATVWLGPFLDSSDGDSEETGLTIAQSDIRLSKAGAAWAQSHNTAGAAHGEKAYYGVPLDTTDTDTLGRLKVAIHVAGALACWDEYMVVPANVYDALVAGTDLLDVNSNEIGGVDVVPATGLVKIMTGACTAAATANTVTAAAAGQIFGAEPQGVILVMTSGARSGEKKMVSTFSVTTAGVAAFGLRSALTGAPSAGDTFDVYMPYGATFHAVFPQSKRSNFCQSGSTATAVVLDTGASATDGYYVGDKLVQLATMAAVRIVAYVGSTKTAYVFPALPSAPASGDGYSIQSAQPDEARLFFAGACTLATVTSGVNFTGSSGMGLSSTNDYYNGCFAVMATGAAAGEAAIPITDYVGSTRQFLSSVGFGPTLPSSGDLMIVFKIGRADAIQIDGAAWATHSAGYAPGDVRQFGGSAGTFSGGKAAVQIVAAGDFIQAAADKVWSTTTRTLSAAGVQAIWDALTSALTVTGSIGKALVDHVTAWTAARAGYVDNLNVGGVVASQADMLSIQNNTRAVRSVPAIIERPDSGTETYRVEFLLYDNAGNMEAPDSAPTIALVNQAGTDLSARLDSATMALVSTGRYRAVYTASDTDDLEQLNWAFSVVEGGATRVYVNTSLIVDTTAVDFTGADRSDLQALVARLTSGRAANLDNLDATVSSRAAPGDAMALTSGERSTLATAVWSVGTRTLSSFGTLVSDIVTALGSSFTTVYNAVMTRLAASSYTAAPTAAENADAVWDESSAAHNTDGTMGGKLNGVSAGSDPATIAAAVWEEAGADHTDPATMGGKMNAAGGAADPLANDLGDYPSGTAGGALQRIGSAIIEVKSPIDDGGTLTLIRQDSYLSDDGRAIEWTEPESGWPDISAATIEFIAPGISVAGSVIDSDPKKVLVELTSEQTSALAAGRSMYAVRVTFEDGHKATFVRGELVVAVLP